jgi:hypothetical protein
LEYADRLTRFGFSFLEGWFKEFGVKIHVTEPIPDYSPEKEFIEDIMALLTCFAGKLYRFRALERTQTERLAKKEHKYLRESIARCNEKSLRDTIRQCQTRGKLHSSSTVSSF